MNTYIPLMSHVIVIVIAMVLGIYTGIITREVLKYYILSYRPKRKKQKIIRLEKKRENKIRKKEEKKNEKMRIKELKKEEKIKKSKSNEKEIKTEKKINVNFPQKRKLKDCIYDKTSSWTEFNCVLDGEESNSIIKENRKSQDESYNIIRRKKQLLKT